MHLKRLELNGFKSFAHKSEFVFDVPIISIVGPNGSGKSNVVESIRFVLGEQSVKSMRGKTGSDLIFKGSKDISKLNRASVSIVFDNKDRVFHLHQDNNERVNIDFDEVTISREVFSDGVNKYLVNGSEVRMKDVHELIASVNIGASGHHIISQGEADRYLNSNVKDRRELIEEALGLKVYQYRIKESQRKLKRAEDNIRESELLRREIAPHLRFLKKQVDKIEKAKHLRTDLHEQYKTYFAQEDYFIKTLERALDADRTILQEQYNEVIVFLDSHTNPEDVTRYEEESQIISHQQRLKDILREAVSLRQKLGSIEGMISLLEKQQAPSETKQHPGFSFKVVHNFLTSLLGRIDLFDSNNTISSLGEIKSDIQDFIKQPSTAVQNDNSSEITELMLEKNDVEKSVYLKGEEEQSIQSTIAELEAALELKRNNERESQRQYYEYLAKKKELDTKRTLITHRDETLGIRVQGLKEEHEEARVLLGLNAIEYQAIALEHEMDISAQTQEQARREMERIKIRLEDIGGGSGIEVIQEFQETLDRDQFLEKEITDITSSIESLNIIIDELKGSLDMQFDIGIQKINDQFDRFFKLMFGGGQAKLTPSAIKKRKKKITEEGEQLELLDDEEGEKIEYGIDINVQLPRKKVSDLDMLSGGERSLTSIALLFALSQVNPPPFLVLDETDAALDEANSKKYGDMIESLSKYSQLILVTHNRETMSRAQTLFGVTLGRGDASTTLSLRLEDAAKYAK
ncbi:MAG: chromosome segregation protein [Candidatus Paceibacteria bacterium]|jgi:chromosome segregation protein